MTNIVCYFRAIFEHVRMGGPLNGNELRNKRVERSYKQHSSSYVALQLFYRVLAFSTNSFYLLLSWARVFQSGTFNFCMSFLTSSTQRVFGLPIGLLEMGFQEYIAFTILVPCILSM